MIFTIAISMTINTNSTGMILAINKNDRTIALIQVSILKKFFNICFTPRPWCLPEYRLLESHLHL